MTTQARGEPARPRADAGDEPEGDGGAVRAAAALRHLLPAAHPRLPEQVPRRLPQDAHRHGGQVQEAGLGLGLERGGHPAGPRAGRQFNSIKNQSRLFLGFFGQILALNECTLFNLTLA